MMSLKSVWKASWKKFSHDFKGFSKNEKVVKINKAMLEMANSFNMGVDEDDIEKLLEVVLEELFELEQESMAVEEVREIKTTEEKEPPR